MFISPESRALHRQWLSELTRIPTAAGREERVIEWIRRWVDERDGLEISEDVHGNLTIAAAEPWTGAGGTGGTGGKGEAPIYFTAHLDHPAFVVERVIGPQTVQLAFRGGVMDDYFDQGRVVIHTARGDIGATLTGSAEGGDTLFKRFTADLDDGASADDVTTADIATWELPEPEEIDGIFHTNACDDLAAAAAALGALDELRARHAAGKPVGDVRILLTRAEEIGFIGAIGACRDKTMPLNSRVIALENSRSFDDSPLGGGPIVRVGDRLSIFSPALTAAVAQRAEEVAGGPSSPTAAQKMSDLPKWKWQRKLMAGGACEATVFCNAGYESTCVCLPLGNYHNMADLAAVQAGAHTGRPQVGREFISLSDYEGLVDLLVACGEQLTAGGAMGERIEKLWNERRFVLED
jgi:putative aminopeptidase FrvX